MHSKKQMFLLLPLLLLLTAACLPQPTLRSELFLDDRSLITGEPCGAPCWNGITPGETLWPDALDVIENDETFSGLDTNSEGGFVQAAWQKAGSGQFCCRIIADDENSPVSFLFLALSPDIIVDEVLDVYGEPQYVTTFRFTDEEAVIQLVYPDIPMAVSVLVGTPDASLLANSEVVAVLYMSPEEMSLILDTSELQAWEGYQPYLTYEESTPVVTPRVTLTPRPEE